MFTHYRTKAIILKKVSRKETSKMLIVFSYSFGRIDILAKGICRMESKLRGNIPLFGIANLEFIQGRAYKTLTDAVIFKDFPNIRKDLIKLEVAEKIVDIFHKLIKPPQKDKEIWKLFEEVFGVLNKDGKLKNAVLIYYYFLWHLLSILGYLPQLYSCISCGGLIKPKNLFFSFQGGLVCEKCQRSNYGLHIKVNTIKIFREILKKDLKSLLKLKAEDGLWKELGKVSSSYLSSLPI